MIYVYIYLAVALLVTLTNYLTYAGEEKDYRVALVVSIFSFILFPKVLIKLLS